MIWKKTNEDSKYVIYEKGTRECKLVAFFDKEIKAVIIEEYEWVSNGTPRLEPMSEFVRYSAKYGHTQRTCPTLSLEDIEFLYKKSKELLGGVSNEYKTSN